MLRSTTSWRHRVKILVLRKRVWVFPNSNRHWPSKTEVLRNKVMQRITGATRKGKEKSGTKVELLEEIKKFERYAGVTVPNINASASKSVVVYILYQL